VQIKEQGYHLLISSILETYFTMSTENETVADADEVCASCGKAAVDDVKLKDCDDGCDLVKFCSDGCQHTHREQHEEECKKRLTELRERDLFEQPDESHLGECPICFFPLPLDNGRAVMMVCCSKSVCRGCDHVNEKLIIESGFRDPKCLFCREPAAKSPQEAHQLSMKRIKKNDPAAMSNMGRKCLNRGDYESAFKYLTKAAELGDAEAHYALSVMYHRGNGVKKDTKKRVFHLEEAAIGGHHMARHNLGCKEVENGKFERAKKHFIIAANLGCNESLKCLKELYASGHATKEDYAAALLTYQSAVEATKTPQREEAKAYDEYMKSLGIKDHGGAIWKTLLAK
jgi:hypothetical protein